MNRGFLSLILGSVLFWAGLVVLLFLWLSPGQANAMTAADIPAVPPQAVEVCDHRMQTVCPLVALASALYVTAEPTIPGTPSAYGHITRFEPTPAGEMGAWVRLRDGRELFFPLHLLTLVVDRGPR